MGYLKKELYGLRIYDALAYLILEKKNIISRVTIQKWFKFLHLENRTYANS